MPAHFDPEMFTCVRDPQAKLDYGWDWAAPPPKGPWLAEGETIVSAVVTAEDGINLDSFSHTETRVTAWISGGTAGKLYDLTCHVVTNQGREDDRTIRLQVRDR